MDAAVGDYEQGGVLLDFGSFEKIGAFFGDDVETNERLMVVAQLQYLGDVAVDEAAAAGKAGGEKTSRGLAEAS